MMFWNPYFFQMNMMMSYYRWISYGGQLPVTWRVPMQGSGYPAMWTRQQSQFYPFGQPAPLQQVRPEGTVLPQPVRQATSQKPVLTPAVPDVGTASASKKKKKRQDFDVSDFTAQGLLQNDLDQIITKCGSGIDEIYNLAPGQKWMFEKANEVSSAFFLQLLFKAVIPIKPHELRQKIEEVSERRDNLRSAYAYRDVSQPYRVVLKNRPVELRFEDLSGDDEYLDKRLKSIMEADRRRGFDLEKDPLLRIAVYATGEQDTYAILVSQPHINTDGISMMLLMKDIFIDYALEMNGIDLESETFSYKEYADWLESRDRDVEISYWKELLRDAPALTKIPALMKNGLTDYRMETISRVFPEEVQKGLKRKQSAFHATQNNLMQAAWAVLLMKLYGTQDCMFGAITSGREAGVAGSGQIAGGFVNAIPVRAEVQTGKESVAMLVSCLQKQLMESLEKSHLSPGELERALDRKEPLFDHLLNFHNFMQGNMGRFAASPSIPGIKLVGSEMYDNLSMDLVVYFVNTENGLGTNFVFNQNHLTRNRIDVLMDCFYSVVEQIALGGEDITIDDIDCPDVSVFRKAIENEQSLRQEIEIFIDGLKLFNPEHSALKHKLAMAARLESFQMDDLIINEGQENTELMFVYNGFVELSRKAMDGWMKPLMLLKTQKMISAAGLVKGSRCLMEARAASEAKVLVFPSDMVRSIMNQCPEFAIGIISEQEKRANAFSLLWINAE